MLVPQAMAAPSEAGAAGCGLWARQEQADGEQESQREESREEGVRESHPASVPRDGRTQPAGPGLL